MYVEVKERVREIVAPELWMEDADDVVLRDLATWTLAPMDARRRTASVVSMFGRRFRYAAKLTYFTLPEGWCLCADRRACSCRDAPKPGDRRAIILIGAKAIGARDQLEVSTGDAYDTPLTTSFIRDSSWWPEASARWMRVQERVASFADGDDGAGDPLRRWQRILEMRRAVAEARADPLPYMEVDLEDETGLLVFRLAQAAGGASAVPPDVIYELEGRRELPAKLRTIDVDDDGRLRCEVEPPGDPVEIAAYAEQLSGHRRRLVRDAQATSAVLAEEQRVMRNALKGAAVNPELLRLIRQPERAALDAWLPAPDELFAPKLDPAQRHALDQALRARQLIVVQGPPGTGKTTFIAELVLQHLHEHPADTVLLAAQTHQAIDNLLRRVHSCDPDIALVRVGYDSAKIAPDILPFWLHVSEPWQRGVRMRAERFRRCASAMASVGDWDDGWLKDVLAIQDEYLASEGVQRSEEERLAGARVVAGTCYGVSKNRAVQDRTYALAVLEEAGKALASEALMAMLQAYKVVLVGDSRQLPPKPDRPLEQVLRCAARGAPIEPDTLAQPAAQLARDLLAERERIVSEGGDPPARFAAETLFAYVARRLHSARPELEVTLRRQYRMASGIGELISECFYDGRLEHDDDHERHAVARSAFPAHVRLVDVRGREAFNPGSTSAYNAAEVEAVRAELRRLSAAATKVATDAPLGVAVITGYAAQRQRLQSAIGQFEGLVVRTGLIDRFQGDEEEIVIFSAVRTGGPGFLVERPRINVAFSRARSLLVVCANLRTARSGKLGRPLADAVAFCDERLAVGDERYELATVDGRRP